MLDVKLLFADRAKNLSYIFRHAEAAGIMIMLDNEQYAGHAEHAWATIQKITLGVMFTTQDVRPQLQCSYFYNGLKCPLHIQAVNACSWTEMTGSLMFKARYDAALLLQHKTCEIVYSRLAKRMT